MVGGTVEVTLRLGDEPVDTNLPYLESADANPLPGPAQPGVGIDECPMVHSAVTLDSEVVHEHRGWIGARMVTEMDRVPPQPVKDLPNLVRVDPFSLERLLSHVDPGTAKESEDFVRRIYEQRHIDLSSDRDGKTGR